MADIKLVYGTPAAVTIGLATGPLASDANFLAGRESTAIDNGTERALDYEISGKITVGTSPTTAKELRVYVVGLMDDTPTWPDGFTGSDANKTVSTAGTRDAACRLAAVIATVATSDQGYWFGPISVAALFGGLVPKKFLVWVVHNTGVALNSTAGNHVIKVRPIYEAVA